jgi:hypothetical protein
MTNLRTGVSDRADFAPDLWQQVELNASGYRRRLLPLGPVESAVPIARRQRVSGTAYEYRVTFMNGTVSLTCARGVDGRLTALSFEVE